jgi:hypothetical protein
MPAIGAVARTPTNIAGVKKYTLVWTSSAGGAVSGDPFTVDPGYLVAAKFVPASGGSQPTDLYDLTLVDTDGIDVLGGVGANLSNVTPKYSQMDPPRYIDGAQALDLVVANAGAAKVGTLVVWIR